MKSCSARRNDTTRVISDSMPSASNPIESAAKAAYAQNPVPELSPNDFNVKGGLFFATPENRGNVIVDKGSIAPRIGLAYRIFPRTVIRSGFGIFYSAWWQPFVRATGFASNTPMVTTLDGGLTPADTLANPFPNGLIEPTGSSLGLKTLLGSSLAGTYDYWRKNQRNFRWNFGFQQEIAHNLAFEVNYVGQRGTRLPLSSAASDSDRSINSLDQKYYALGSRLNARIPNPFQRPDTRPESPRRRHYHGGAAARSLSSVHSCHASKKYRRRQLLSFATGFGKQAIQRGTDIPSCLHLVEAAREAALHRAQRSGTIEDDRGIRQPAPRLFGDHL